MKTNSIILALFLLAGCGVPELPYRDGDVAPDAAEGDSFLVDGGDAGTDVDADAPDADPRVDADDVDAGDVDAGPTGCTSSTECDDGDACTIDVCAASVCTHGPTGECSSTFVFPEASATRTDTRVLASAPYWTAAGDYEEKVVSLPTVPYATHLDIDDAGFVGGGCVAPGTFRVLVNGVEVGSFMGASTLPSPVHLDFPAITGPGYVVRLEQTAASSGNCLLRAGSGTSMTTLRAP